MKMLSEQRERIFESQDFHRIRFEIKKINLEFLFGLCQIINDSKVDSLETLIPIVKELDNNYIKLAEEINKIIVDKSDKMYSGGFLLVLKKNTPLVYKYYHEFIRKSTLWDIKKEIFEATYQ